MADHDRTGTRPDVRSESTRLRSKRPLLPEWTRGPAWFRGQRHYEKLADLFRLEAERGRLVLWSPCIFLCGISLYFILPREPVLVALLTAALVFLVIAIRTHRKGRTPFTAAAIALVFCGLSVAKLETDRVLSPRIESPLTANIVGILDRIEPAKRRRVRLTIMPEKIDGVDVETLPRLIRISAFPGGADLQPGDRISVLARLRPPSGPVMPGGFDFSFPAYFEGRGAGGYAIGKIQLVQRRAVRHSVARDLADRIARVRSFVGDRISENLPNASGTIARALIVGERQAIPEPLVTDLRQAGLAHILAISGLHMMLLAGSMIWVARAALALSPQLALNYPIRKWAGAIGLATGFLYLLLSGASVATERAFIMVGVAIVAMFIDRPALTLRSLMVAAFIVATLFPHSVMGPSFQMSFLAVAALIGLAEWMASRVSSGPPGNGYAAKAFYAFKLYFVGIALTSLLAGAATAPLAAYHFHTIAPLSLLGNILAMPIVGTLIMPFGFLGCLLIPFGLDMPAFQVMGYGIDLVISIAHFVAGLSDGAEFTGRISLLTPLLCAIGILWLAIWQTNLRWAGAALFIAGVAAAPWVERPDVLINQSGTAVLVNPENPPIAILRGRGTAFEARLWLRAHADARSPRDPTLQDGFRCDQEGCTYKLARPLEPSQRDENTGDDMIIAIARTRQALLEDCHRADILVSNYDAPANCPRPLQIFDRRRLEKSGSISVHLDKYGSLSIRTTKPEFPRPWNDPNAFSSARTSGR